MRVTPEILRQEFISLDTEVVRSSNSSLVGVAGKVVDETRNTLVIRNKTKNRIVIKDVSVFIFTLSDGTIVEIDGKAIVGRPENRVKKRIRGRW